jgi:hypothetical protein
MRTHLQTYKDMIIALAGRGEVILAINDLTMFGDLSQDEIVAVLVDCGAGQEVEKNLHKFSNLHLNTAKKLIQRGVAHTIWRNIEVFDPNDRDEIKTLLLSKGYANTVLGI